MNRTPADIEYEQQRNMLIPFAEGAANRATKNNPKSDPARWNRTFFAEMTRLSVNHGLINEHNLELIK